MIIAIVSARDFLRIFQILEKNQFNTGSVHQMFQAAAGLRERGHTTVIISRDDPTLAAKAREEGIAFYPLPFRSDVDLVTLRGIARLAGEIRPDVIHVHKGRPHTLALAATWRQPPLAFVVNRGVSFPLTFWNRPKYRTRRVDRIVTVCQQIKDVVVESGHVPWEKVEVIYAGTDMTFFDPGRWSPSEFRAEKNIPPERFLITQVGVRDWKGWRELLDSVSDVARVDPRVHVALIGCKDASEQEEIRSYAASLGMAGRVTAVEARHDMPRVFAASDLVTDASWAGTGITGTIREAMAMGKPTISTDCGGNVELVSSAEVGWLVPAKKRQALTEAILEVMAQPERSHAVGATAMEHVRRSFSREVRLDRLEELYRSIVESKLRR
jgi:glycosyltransferase involved in cell wall biosynthesis